MYEYTVVFYSLLRALHVFNPYTKWDLLPSSKSLNHVHLIWLCQYTGFDMLLYWSHQDKFLYPLSHLANKSGSMTQYLDDACQSVIKAHTFLKNGRVRFSGLTDVKMIPDLGLRRGGRASCSPMVESRVCESCCVRLICSDLLWSLPGGLCVAVNAMTG